MSCGICKKDVHDSDMQLELECGKHIAHAAHESFDCKVCALHVSSSIDGAAGARGEKTDLERRKQHSAARVNEPLSSDRPPEPGFVGNAIALISRHVAPLFARAGVAPESLPPRELLKQRVPLSDLVSKYGYDITELINDHKLDINDFFENDYTVGQMIQSFTSRMNKKDGLNVLSALGIQAEHFRCVPELVSVDVMKSAIGYKPSDLVDRFHFTYKSPVDHGTEAWTLQDMINAGLKFEDVCRAGMTCETQWMELKSTVAPLALPKLEREFGATPDAISRCLVPKEITAQIGAHALAQKQQQEQQRLYQAILAEATRNQAPVQQQFPQAPGQMQQQSPYFQQQQPAGYEKSAPIQIRQSASVSTVAAPMSASRQGPVSFNSMFPTVTQKK